MNVLLALLLVSAEPVSVGQKVMPKTGAVLQLGAVSVADDRKNGLPYIVGQVRPPWVLVGDAQPGWMQQSQVVPLADAPSYYAALIQAEPTEWLHRMRGIAWHNLGEFDKAIIDFDEAIRREPNEVCYIHRGETLRRKRDFDRAIADFSEAIRRDPQYGLAYASRGMAWRNKGEVDRAIQDFDAAIRLIPGSARIYGHRGNAWLAKGDFDRALADYGEAIRISPRFALAYGGRAYAWRSKGELDRALDDYDQAIMLDPANAQAWTDQGTALCDKGDFSSAIASFEKALELTPSDFRLYTYRGLARLRLGEYQQAFEDQERSLSMAPTEPLSVAALAWFLATCPDEAQRDGKRALELAVRACELSEYKAAPWLESLAAAHAELGDFEQAVRWQEKAVELDTSPKSREEARTRLALYQSKQPFREKAPEPAATSQPEL